MENCEADVPSVQNLIAEFEGHRDIEMSKKMVNRSGGVNLKIARLACNADEDNTCGCTDSRNGQSGSNRVMYEKISPSNRLWLRTYFIVGNIGVVLLIIAYTFYIIGLFEPILFLDAGEFTDPTLFQPFQETLPHSIITLYKQKAYFTVFVAGLFSITLPFVKMIVTALAYITALHHRKTQLKLFFGSNPIDKSGIRRENEGNIKYAREMLIILKLISKFQMVDVVILLLNTVFLRSAFLWARPGKGLLYLIMYCLLSIAGAQMVNFCVEGEKDIFDSWYAIKYAILPPKFSVASNSSSMNDDGSSREENASIQNKKRWYTSEDFICLMAGLNILSCLSLMANEKFLSVSFTLDSRKILAMDSTSMSYTEFITNLHGMDYGRICIAILFFLCIMFPLAFSLLFIASIFWYNYCKRNRSHPRSSVEIAGSNDDVPKLEHDWDIKITCFMFKLCNIVSEWSCGEVVSLGTMAAYISMATADRVRVAIPPKNTCSALFMMGAFGITSFLLMAVFYIWNQKVKCEFSHIRIYVKYLESPNPNYIARLMSANNFTEQCSCSTHSRSSQNLEQAEEREEQVMRCRFFVPYIEGMRLILYSKWLSSVFFGLLTAVVVLFTMSSYTYSYPTPYVNPQAVNNYLQSDLKEVFKLVLGQVPHSIGYCNDPAEPAEEPCMGNAPLLEVKGSLYGGIIWASGLKTLELENANYSISEDKRMVFTFQFSVREIKALVRVGAIKGEEITKLLQGVINTTDGGFKIQIKVSAQCVNRRPQLRDLRVDETVMENFNVLGSIGDTLKELVDMNVAAATMITTKVNELLRDNRQRILWRGISFDITEMLNLIVSNNWPTTFVCPVSDP